MIKKLTVSLILLLGLTSSAFAASAFGLDTVAGEATVLRSAQLSDENSVVFDVRKPNGEIVKIESKGAKSGVAIEQLSDYHTRLAGKYGVKIGDDLYNYFTVFPADLDVYKSSVFPVEQVVSGNDTGRVTVTLVDEFGNPIGEHKVKLLPNTKSASFTYASREFTNRDGEIVFNLTSSNDGIVKYSVYDVTADKVLDEQVSAIFLNGNYVKKNNFDNLTLSAVGNSSGPVDSLVFSDLPNKIEAGEVVSFSVEAVDALEETVVSYDGEVRFSIAGSNGNYVSLPDDYTFRLEDQGEHTFSLSLLFNVPGTYVLRVTDLDNLSVFGEVEVDVIEKSSLNIDPSNVEGVIVTNPLAGTYSNAVQVVSGFATPGAGLKIFDNDLEVTELVADLDGRFTFTTQPLPDGEHNIYVAEVNEIGTIVEVSEPVSFSIDTEASEIGEITFSPEGQVIPGSVVNVQVEVEDRLSALTLVIDDSFYDLDYNFDGYYEGAFAAPMDFGNYDVSFEVIDQLGNESVVDEAAVLRVGAFDFEEKVTPAIVSNVIAKEDDRRVILSWDPVYSDVNEIVRYRVYYGLSPTDLSQAVDTFTNSTTWYVPNLINGQTYYFAVVAVDDRTNISDAFSNIVMATPQQVVVDVVVDVDVMEGSAGQEALAEMDRDVADAGPGMAGLLLFSTLGGYCYRKLR